MDISKVDGLVVFIIGNFLIWLIQFVVLKTDMKWIKDRMRKGDKILNDHGSAISTHDVRIESIEALCQERHGIKYK